VSARNRVRDGAACRGCGLPNYQGLCPVCRADFLAYVEELEPHFGPWFEESDEQPENALSVPPEKRPR
jgi:hypothetical protein